jgi:hypothetical protein
MLLAVCLAVLRQAAGTILSWVNICFEDAAAAAVQASDHSAQRDATHQQQQQQQQHPPLVQPCTPLRRPLPLHTLLALCDRRGAFLRRSLADVAAVAVEACGGCLPVITRTYDLDGAELLTETLGPEEWLWSSWCQDTQTRRKLRAGEQGASEEEEEEGDLYVLESM